MMIDSELMQALIEDGEKLKQLTGEDHGPYFVDEWPAPIGSVDDVSQELEALCAEGKITVSYADEVAQRLYLAAHGLNK
jgi:hypothetical protein